MAHNLHALYSYVISRLTLANLRNDVSILEEADRLIRPIREAWVEIGPQVARRARPDRTLAASAAPRMFPIGPPCPKPPLPDTRCRIRSARAAAAVLRSHRAGQRRHARRPASATGIRVVKLEGPAPS